MKIAFASFVSWDFHPRSADLLPMGGAYSAACHLARSLARAGHEIIFLSFLSRPGIYDGIACYSWKETSPAQLRSLNLDAFVCILRAGNGATFRKQLGPATSIVLWNQHSFDQPGVAPLLDAEERAAYDGFAMVSEWQCDQFQRHFGLDPARMTVLRNAIGPAFLNLFPEDESILAQKTQPPVLAYTSTPFRGLDLLLQAFPRIRQAVPGTRLQVFSSTQVYQASQQEDEANYGALYRRCRETEGVEYFGSVPQPELSRALCRVTALAYPNTFRETSCIAVMEALASGCRVVTSDLAALSETAAGFAGLIPADQSRAAYLEQFIDETIRVLQESAEHREQTERFLRAQVTYMNQNATWTLRAAQWIEWLRTLSPV